MSARASWRDGAAGGLTRWEGGDGTRRSQYRVAHQQASLAPFPIWGDVGQTVWEGRAPRRGAGPRGAAVRVAVDVKQVCLGGPKRPGGLATSSASSPRGGRADEPGRHIGVRGNPLGGAAAEDRDEESTGRAGKSSRPSRTTWCRSASTGLHEPAMKQAVKEGGNIRWRLK